MTTEQIFTMARDQRWRVTRIIHALNNHDRLRAFRDRQLVMAACALNFLLWSNFSDWLLAPAMLVIQAGWIEALRFRRTGCIVMTRRSIWIGATPVDARARHLLNGWHP